ncbi:MAG: hypothetical protein ACJA01_004354 [Saprospiraceae bacterium]|jgi:hypothetical protein
MNFFITWIFISLLILLGLVFICAKFNLIPSEENVTLTVFKMTRIEPENARIENNDLIVFGTSPSYYAFAGKTDSYGRGRELLTSVDSLLVKRDSHSWAYDVHEGYNGSDIKKSSYKHRKGYVPFNNIDSLFSTGIIKTLYRYEANGTRYTKAIGVGIFSELTILFLICYFLLSITDEWDIRRRSFLIFVFALIGCSFHYGRRIGSEHYDAVFSKGEIILFLHCFNWILFLFFVFLIMHFKRNFKSKFKFQSFIFIAIVILFPLTHLIAQSITPFIFEDFYNSYFYIGRIGYSLPTIVSTVLGLGIALAGMTFFAIKEFRVLEENKKIALQDQLRTKEQLNSLNARLNPHFLYNSLNSIAGLIHQNPNKAEEMTLAVSRFLKHFSNRKEEHVISVRDELDVILDYISIERIRFGNKLSFEYEVGEDVLDEQIPRSILQPLIENAVKYGYSTEDDQIKVKLFVKRGEDQLVIQVFDSGKLFDTTLDKGYGISSVYNKLDLLYKNNYRLEFVNEPEKHIEIIIASDKLLPYA